MLKLTKEIKKELELRQKGISIVNEKLQDKDYLVYDYYFQDHNTVLIIVLEKGKEKIKVYIPSDKLPHRSGMISVMRYPDSMINLIEEHMVSEKD